MIRPKDDAEIVDLSKFTPEQVDSLKENVDAEQTRRNRLRDLEIVVSDELDEAQRRIMQRLTD